MQCSRVGSRRFTELVAVGQMLTGVLLVLANVLMLLVAFSFVGGAIGPKQLLGFVLIFIGPLGLVVSSVLAIRSDYQWTWWFVSSLASTLVVTCWSVFIIINMVLNNGIRWSDLIVSGPLPVGTSGANLTALAICLRNRVLKKHVVS